MLLNQHSAFVWHPDIAARSQRAIAATGNHISHHFADADHVRHSKCSIWVTHDSPGSSGVGMGPANLTPNSRHVSIVNPCSEVPRPIPSTPSTSATITGTAMRCPGIFDQNHVPTCSTFGGSVVHVRARDTASVRAWLFSNSQARRDSDNK